MGSPKPLSRMQVAQSMFRGERRSCCQGCGSTSEDYLGDCKHCGRSKLTEFEKLERSKAYGKLEAKDA